MSIDANGFFRPVTRQPPVFRTTIPRTTTTSATITSLSSSSNHLSESGLSVGDFAEATGLPSQTNGFTTSLDVEAALPALQKASYKSRGVVGVVKSNVNQRAHVIHSGVVFAWVTRGALEPPLSGIYEKSINGVFDSHVVIDVHQDNSFTMAATHDSDLLLLKQRLDALTKPPS